MISDRLGLRPRRCRRFRPIRRSVQHVAADPADVIGHLLVPDLRGPSGSLLEIAAATATHCAQNRVQLISSSSGCKCGESPAFGESPT